MKEDERWANAQMADLEERHAKILKPRRRIHWRAMFWTFMAAVVLVKIIVLACK